MLNYFNALINLPLLGCIGKITILSCLWLFYMTFSYLIWYYSFFKHIFPSENVRLFLVYRTLDVKLYGWDGNCEMLPLHNFHAFFSINPINCLLLAIPSTILFHIFISMPIHNSINNIPIDFSPLRHINNLPLFILIVKLSYGKLDYPLLTFHQPEFLTTNSSSV